MTGPGLAAGALAQALLQPRSIALYGASDDPGKIAGRPLQFLQRAGYAGRIYPINPGRPQVQGLKAWPSLDRLPEVPEQVFVLTPTGQVLAAAHRCAALGVKLVTILASGFSESGREGLQREAELRDLARASGMRILGPSSLGVVNPRVGLVLTANAVFAEPELPVGKVFVASHSGSMIGALVSRGKARAVGFAGLVSVGSEADLSLGEICQVTLDDPGIEGYLLFLESLRHGAALQRFARAAAACGKPVIAYKLGRSEAAAQMAGTHTGALAGADDIADAFLKDLGIARVQMLESLLEALPLAQRLPLPLFRSDMPPARRVGVVSTTGGGAAMVVDQLGVRGLQVQCPSEATQERLKAAGIPGNAGRVLDLTLAGTRYAVMKAALQILLDAPEFDMLIAVLGSSARLQPQLALQPILDSASHRKPLMAMLLPDAPQALAQLSRAAVPCFRTPEGCADVLAAVLARRSPGAPACPDHAGAGAPPGSAGAAFIDEAQSYAVLDELQLPHAPVLTAALAGPVPGVLPFPFPVAVKLCSAQILHKTEVGGVVLGVDSAQALSEAFATLRQRLTERLPGVPCEQVLLQPMCQGLIEVLLGYRVDPDTGPIVLLAAGGIWAELVRERSIRLAPVGIGSAWEMIGEVRALQTVAGLRGQPKGDLAALAQAISDLSQLALRPELGVVQAEMNPMLVLREGQGVLALDAVVMRKDWVGP
ncbi:acetate--CoA ligase family protein [Verminephrobacter sp. Larva24]|nr:acetate--CoA ligase family protein [Verminephrobacter sp. Larva24]